MEGKTLTPDADAPGADADADAPKTLAAGELVWAKPKGRRRCWWPARLLAACPADAAAASRGASVSYFGDPGAPPGPAQIRCFADPEADGMARGSTSRAFVAAVEEAHAHAVAALRAVLTCGCVPPPPPGTDGGSVAGVANLAPAEFLAALREAALGVSPVGLVDRARLKSWVRAFGEGWGPGGAEHYPRRLLEDLVDKIDLDVPAGEDKDADDWLAEDEREALESPQETPAQKKKRGVAAVMEELDTGEDENKDDSAAGPGSSGKRERKKSKYLSPPYTNLGVVILPRKAADLSKALVPTAAEDDSKMSPESIVLEEVLMLVRGFGKDIRHRIPFPAAAEEFLNLFRKSAFMGPADYESYKAHEYPAAHVFGKVEANVALAVVSDSHAVLKQGKNVSKMSRKKDEDGSGSSSIKRKRQKTSPASTVGFGLPITPAIPIRQVKAEDIRSQMKAGAGAEKSKPSLFKCSNSAAVPAGIKPGQEQVQANDGSVVKTPSPLAVGNTLSDQSGKESDEAKLGDEKSKPLVLKCPISSAVPGATKPEQQHVQANDESVLKTPPAAGSTLSDQSAKENDEARLEATKSERNVQAVTVDVLVTSIQTEAEANIRINENVQHVVAGVPVRSASKEATELEANIHIDENVQSVVADVPDRSVSKEGVVADVPDRSGSKEGVVADVPVRSVSKEGTDAAANIRLDEHMQSVVADVPLSSGPSPMRGYIAQAIDENKDHASVEVRTVQQSYASLQAMVPEMLKKVENTNGTDVITVKHSLKDECQKDEQPNQKMGQTAGAAANHSSGESTNGVCPDPGNSTQKKKKKKAAQYFENPAAIYVEFTRGVIVPSREELLFAFGKFGFLIESQTDITKATRSARVVFGKSTEADKAYNSAELLGEFGPPFATLRLDYLPPIELSMPSPSPPPSLASKPPLTEIRKNLEKMISAHHSSLKKTTPLDGLKPVSDKLLGEMQGLLARVDEMLCGPSTSTP